MKKLLLMVMALLCVEAYLLQAQTDHVAFQYDNNGNRIETSFVIFRVDESDFDKPETDVTDIDLSIYPNPTDGYIALSMGSHETDGFHARLLAANGNTITEVTITSDQTVFDMSEYTSGVYFMSVENGKERHVWKIIKR